MERLTRELVKVGSIAAEHSGLAELVKEVASRLDVLLARDTPSAVVAKTVTTLWALRFLLNVADVMLEQGLVQSVLDLVKPLPGIAGLVRKEKEKLFKKLEKEVFSKRYGHSKVPKFTEIPKHHLTHEKIFDTIDDLDARDDRYEKGKSKLSGALYFNNSDHADFQTEVYSRFVGTNPIHADNYPSVARMDAELVSMTASMVRADVEEVCGSVTSGGSESILCAMKASRDWWLNANGYGLFRNLLKALPWMKNSSKPEIIMADSAHAAYVKAAEYYNLRMVIVHVDESTDFRLTASAVRRRITANTAIVIASAPSYPHGVCDDIDGIQKLAAKYGIACHVDACLGGFVLPFAKEAGYDRPGFHFGMKGITSMSIDTHKYGLAHKGTSVVLYRDKDIRKYQFTKITDWSGGLYISPTMAGSRSGAVIAAAWSSLLAIGRDGFVKQTKQLLSLAELLASRIEGECHHLKLLGQPDSTVVAWGAKNRKELDIFKVNDAMSKKGWHLSALQHPPGLHMCITPAHSQSMMDKLAEDLKVACEEVLDGDNDGEEGSAPIYGMAESLPDRNIVGDVLVAFQEANLDV